MNKIKIFKDLSAHLCELMKSASYSKSTTKDMMFILNAFSDYMDSHGLKEYTPKIGERLIAHCKNDLLICESRISRAKNIVRKLNRLYDGLDNDDALWGVGLTKSDLPECFAYILDEYLRYCRKNGNGQATANYKRWICGRFLQNLFDCGYRSLNTVDGLAVQKAFLSLGATRYWERISPFLHYLFERGQLSSDYSNLLKFGRAKEPYPTVYTIDEIKAVESSINRSTASGKRNYAILLLMSRYGIRACDIACLSLSDIDFPNNRISFIQRKTGVLWQGKMLPEIKSALQEYLKSARPNIESQRLFITLGIPYKPIDYRTVNTMINTVFSNSGVAVEGKRHGSRSFRSSVASNMINDSVSTEVVRRLLGHETKYALKHYAKLDIEKLRLCSLPVPKPQGDFCKLLNRSEVSANV